MKWFGYTRRERRSTFILLIILIIVILVRILIPHGEIEVEDLSQLLKSAAASDTGSDVTAKESLHPFKFDPNSASFDTLTMLGLSDRQARTLISYREKGGRFRKSDDIRKIYGIDDQAATVLIPYIVINHSPGKAVAGSADTLIVIELPRKLELNSCDSADLDRLPGIGPVLSSRIIKFRKLLGGFATVEQLKEVYGLSEAAFNGISERVTADSSLIVAIRINDIGSTELLKHPYLTRYESESIMKYKELNGRLLNAAELVDNKIMTPEKVKKISPYLKF